MYTIPVQESNGAQTTLEKYRGKAMLIVNVASECGFTPQYDGLEALYKKYKDQGLVVLGFPCNQFGAQEPGTDQQIQEFCRLNHGVTFPIFAKIDVNGANAAPVYQYLKKEAPGLFGTEGIKWNFTKFLIGKNGEVLERFAPTTKPEAIEKDVEKVLGL